MCYITIATVNNDTLKAYLWSLWREILKRIKEATFALGFVDLVNDLHMKTLSMRLLQTNACSNALSVPSWRFGLGRALSEERETAVWK